MKMVFWYPHIFWYKETELETEPEKGNFGTLTSFGIRKQ